MEYFRADVKVGAFLLVSLALLVVAAIVVGDIGNWFTAKYHYTVLLPNANLLHRRAQVSYAGHPVGEVIAIAVRSEVARAQHHPQYPIAVTIAVQPSVPLREDSRVEMKTDGFIGDRYLDISPGEGPRISPGGTIIGSIGGVEGMLASLSGIGGDLDEVRAALHTLFADASQPHSLSGTLARVNRLLDTLVPRLTTLSTAANDLLQETKQEVAQTSNKAGHTLQRLDATIAENRKGIQQLIHELNISLVEARQTVAAMRQFLETRQNDIAGLIGSLQRVSESLQRQTEETMTQIQQLLRHTDAMVVQNDRNIYITIENLRDTTANLKATSQLLRANPSIILWGKRGADGTNSIGTGHNTNRLLQDRGRMGRYDRTP
jgi:phospholipid/cholesterol/gamma-HCH transport system substrate-binding protein